MTAQLLPPWLNDAHADNGVPIKDNFAQWFQRSKAVERDGTPKRLYHGSCGDILQFDASIGNARRYTGASENAFFFTDNPHNASGYAGRRTSMTGTTETYKEGANVLPVYLSMQRPLRVSAKGDTWDFVTFKSEFCSTPELVDHAQRNGFDGLIVSRVVDVREAGVIVNEHLSKAPSTVYAVFDANQVKSATGNNGLYLPTHGSLTDKVSGPRPERVQQELFELPMRWLDNDKASLAKNAWAARNFLTTVALEPTPVAKGLRP